MGEIQFTDAAGYDAYMGPWSKAVGDDFLDWLDLQPGLRWLDVGCGSGAFTERIVARCTPRSVNGVDPAPDQIAFAQSRMELRTVNFKNGDAMALPYQDNTFDVAVMPLVIFFVPDPFKGVAEMARVVKPDGTAAAYGWDLTAGGFPYAPVQKALAEVGVPERFPPSKDAADFDRLTSFWRAAGLTDIETRPIEVARTFANANDYWSIVNRSPNLGPSLRSLTPEQLATVKARVHESVKPDADGRIRAHGRAHAIKGRVPS